MEADIVNDLLFMIDGVVHRPAGHIHAHLADLHAGTLGEAILDLTAHHAPDDPILVDVVAGIVDGLDGGAVTDDGDLVGNVGDLVELVGNDDAGHALFLEAQHQVKQRLGIGLVEGRSRLVQNQQLGVLRQSLGDFHHLLLAHADILNEGTGGLGQAHDLQIFIRLGVGGVPVNVEGLALLVAQEHVFADGHVRHQCQLLMDDDDALFFTVSNFGELTNLSIVYDIARIRAKGINAAEDIHQGGLTRAVFSHQRVDGPPFHLKIHVVQRADTGKQLGDIFHFKNHVRQAITSFGVFWAEQESLPCPKCC